MTQLATINKSTAIAAYESMRCAEMPQQDLLPEILRQYRIVLAYSGQSGIDDAETINVIARMIESDLRQTYCTIDQFKIAVQEGMKTTEPYSANAPRTYLKWVQAYLDKTRMEIAAYRRLKYAELEKVCEPTESEKLDASIAHVMAMYQKWVAGQQFTDGGSAGYLWLESIGEIVVSKDEKVEQFEKSKQRAIAAIHAKKEEVSRFEARSIETLLKDISERPNDIPELRFEQIKICRNDLLKAYFNTTHCTDDYLKQRYEASRI